MESELKPEDYSVQTLLESFRNRTLQPDQEYQRGEDWKDEQKQRFIDSLFRGYPLPPLYLRYTHKTLPNGQKAETCEIIDGLQRLIALDGFKQDKFPLLKQNDEDLRLPRSLRSGSA